MMRARATPQPAAKAPQPKPVIQRKVRLGAENDPLEREADRAAAAVLAGGNFVALSRRDAGVQRKCAECEDEERRTIRRKCARCEAEEKALRGKGAGPASQPRIDAAASALSSGGAPLTPQQRAYFEPLFNHDFSAVRLHTDVPAQRAAESIGARAYTYGSSIAFAAGEQSEPLLAHELAHVVQQSPGIIRRQGRQANRQQQRPWERARVVATPSEFREADTRTRAREFATALGSLHGNLEYLISTQADQVRSRSERYRTETYSRPAGGRTWRVYTRQVYDPNEIERALDAGLVEQGEHGLTIAGTRGIDSAFGQLGALPGFNSAYERARENARSSRHGLDTLDAALTVVDLALLLATSGIASVGRRLLVGLARGLVGSLERASMSAATRRLLAAQAERAVIAAATNAGVARSTGQTLMRLRDQAVAHARSTSTSQTSARAFGNLADAEFKRLVNNAINSGALPNTLRTTPRGVYGPDVYDTASGIGWDLTTATVRQVAGHDLRYIPQSLMGAGYRGQALPGGVTITDVLPLVYRR